MYNQHNFNWSLTQKPLVIFIPNWKRKNLLEITLKRFKTSRSKNDWIFLVVNDGYYQDLSDLEDYNLCWFTFERDPIVERNGCMIRNYIIKNIQSEIIATRDPEIFLEGEEDYIEQIFKYKNNIYRPHCMIELTEQMTPFLLDNPFLSNQKLSILRKWNVSYDTNEAFHCGCAIPTQILKDIGGYNEAYRLGYGYEDWSMINRLRLGNYPFYIDKNITGYHIHHPMMRKFKKTIKNNGIVFEKEKRNLQLIANKDREWGKGV